jgi:hypothetical protein
MLRKIYWKVRFAVSRLLEADGLSTNSGSLHPILSSIAGKKLPVYIDKDLNPCFKLNRAPVPHRVFVLSVPKSGTYLIAKILENLGVIDCGVHIATDHLQDNRFADEKILRVRPGNFMVHVPIEKSTRLIYPGQFAFGHIPCFEHEQHLLRDFKKVFSFRDMRDTIISLVRYHDSREHRAFSGEKLSLYRQFKEMPMGIDKIRQWYLIWGNEYADLIRNMFPWKNRSDVFQMKFEILMGDEGKETQFSMLRDLGGLIGLDISDNKIEKALYESLGSETLTYSGKRSSYAEWWNDELENSFTHYGFKELNRLYGYE